MNEIEDAAGGYDALADELELAAAHARVAANHLRGQEFARCGAHGFAASGHIERARSRLAELAALHADRSEPA